jgi:hypothetical protein
METLPAFTAYSNWAANATVVATTFGAVMLAALTHYEGLAWINRGLIRFGARKRPLVLYAVLSLILLHIIEIWLFGLAYHFLLLWPETGKIAGAISTSMFDHIYFSATVFTTVGFGDLSPAGPIRFLAGTEALTGFVLIGWSASFTYLQMEHLWKPPHR